MAQYTAYANYVIYFADLAEYNFAVGIAGSNLLEISPGDAASFFGFVDGVNFNTGGPLNPVKGMYTVSQYGLSDPGNEILHPGPSGIFMSMNVPFRIVPGQAGNPPSIFPSSSDLKLVWSASIVRIGTGINPDVPTRAPVPIRRWIMGFEAKANAEGGSTVPTNLITRDASRTLDGLGFALRNAVGINIIRAVNEFSPALTTTKSWERFYVRVRTFGSINLDIWRSQGSPSPNAGAKLYISPTGQLLVFNRTSTSVETLLTTIGGVFTINNFVKIDVLVEYNPVPSPPGGGTGRVRVFINGIAASDNSIAVASGGLGANNQIHLGSVLGTASAGANTWEIDLDDWMNAEIPNILTVETLNSIDWLLGTHVKSVKINSGSAINWTGQVQSMNQMMVPVNATSGSRLTSTTALATLIGVTDVSNEQTPIGQILAVSAAIVSSFGSVASGTVAGRIGYSIAGGGIVYVATVESVTARYNNTLYPGTGIDVIPQDVVPFSIAYEKANNTVLTTIHGLSAYVEYIGIWGVEDDPLTIPLPRLYILHNAWFPNIAWAFLGPVSDGPVAIKGGTYVGNGTLTSVQLPLPCCFLWIRPLTGGSGGVKWFGASLGGHLSAQEAVIPDDILRVDFDILTGITTFTVIGTNADCNANTVTYQYIAFCDPAMQYNITGAFLHATSVSAGLNPLIDSIFNPLAAFFNFDTLQASSTVRLAYKGPGATGTTGTRVDGTNLANLAELSTGLITSGTDANSSLGYQTNYSVWRTGNNCESIMCQIYSYTGNGAGGTRVINSTPASGRFPLFVYVQPRNAVGFWKDPSDITTSSRQVTGGSTSATAITAVGIDTITVGTTLNANGIVYDVFIFPGDIAGFNNGTYFPGNCLPDALTPAPSPPVGINILGTGGLALNGQPALTLLKDISGIYTLIKRKTNDTLYDRQTGQPSIDVKIPNPRYKTGYIGG